MKMNLSLCQNCCYHLSLTPECQPMGGRGVTPEHWGYCVRPPWVILIWFRPSSALCSARHPAPAPAPRWNYILHSGSAPARLRHNCQVISNLESASTSRHNNRSQQYIQHNLNNGTQLSNRRQIIQISNRNFRIICPTYIIQISILQSRNTNEARRVNHLSLFQYSSICWQNIVSMIFLKDVMII